MHTIWRNVGFGIGLVLASGMSPAMAEQQAAHSHPAHDSSRDSVSISPLVDKVRVATAKYLDINVATSEVLASAGG